MEPLPALANATRGPMSYSLPREHHLRSTVLGYAAHCHNFVNHYNHRRLHSAIGYVSPADDCITAMSRFSSFTSNTSRQPENTAANVVPSHQGQMVESYHHYMLLSARSHRMTFDRVSDLATFL